MRAVPGIAPSIDVPIQPARPQRRYGRSLPWPLWATPFDLHEVIGLTLYLGASSRPDGMPARAYRPFVTQAYPHGQHMPDVRLTLSPEFRPCGSSSAAPAVGSTEALAGSSRATSPASYECRDWRSPAPLGVSISRGQILAIMLSVDENWVRHVTGPDPGPKGAFSISTCRSSLVSGHYTDTPPPRVGQATIPGLSPTRRQTNTALRPRSQSPGRAVCVWPELYLRAHIVRFWPEDRGEEVGGSEKA